MTGHLDRIETERLDLVIDELAVDSFLDTNFLIPIACEGGKSAYSLSLPETSMGCIYMYLILYTSPTKMED